MKNTANVVGGKPIDILLQSISGVSAISPLVAFTTSKENKTGKREVLFFYIVPDITRVKLHLFQIVISLVFSTIEAANLSYLGWIITRSLR
jgi:hypothetical protein